MKNYCITVLTRPVIIIQGLDLCKTQFLISFVLEVKCDQDMFLMRLNLALRIKKAKQICGGVTSHGQICTVVACFSGRSIISWLCFLKVGHGGRALDVYNSVEFCPTCGGGR